jgi:dimethylamine--corrinoid protein Co-methyltransferase
VGDPFGQPITHAVAAGMGGIRTSGDLVMWMQMARKMRLAEAKKYVAEKLKVELKDLADEFVMRALREDLNIGTITAIAGNKKGIFAKRRIAELLGIEINSVTKMLGRD